MLDLGCTHARFDCSVLPLGAIVNPPSCSPAGLHSGYAKRSTPGGAHVIMMQPSHLAS